MATSTAELITRAQELDPGNRALLNLWHRGLDDVAIARLAGGSPEEIALRRQQIVEQLAGEPHPAPGEVHAALDELAASGGTRPGPPVASASRPAAGGVLAEPVALESQAPPQVILPAAVERNAAPAAAQALPADTTDRAESEPAPAPARTSGESPFHSSLALALGIVFLLMLVLAVVVG